LSRTGGSSQFLRLAEGFVGISQWKSLSTFNIPIPGLDCGLSLGQC
jgi:hypothetical protein